MENYIIHRNTELYHFGVKGQKWGIRRYQNTDGSYKSGAEGRYYDPEGSKISGPKKNVSTTGGGMSVAKTTKTTEKIKGYSLMRSSSNSKTPDREKSGGGGGAVEDKKKEEETNNPNATAPYEKTLSDGTKVTVYPTSMKKAQTGKGEKGQKAATFKVNDLYDKIDGIDLDSIGEAEQKQLDNLIAQYRSYKSMNSISNKKTKAIDRFISEYEHWKSTGEKTEKKEDKKDESEEEYEEMEFYDTTDKKTKKTKVLKHHGILGMHWGIRRYQNPDGSYTAEGKRRKSKGKEYSEDYWNAHDKKKVEYMSDKELQKRNNRLQQEQQYKALTKTKSDKAKEEALKAGKKLLAATVGATFMAMAVSYTKKNLPDLISSGAEFLADSAEMSANMKDILQKSPWLL